MDSSAGQEAVLAGAIVECGVWGIAVGGTWMMKGTGTEWARAMKDWK